MYLQVTAQSFIVFLDIYILSVGNIFFRATTNNSIYNSSVQEIIQRVVPGVSELIFTSRDVNLTNIHSLPYIIAGIIVVVKAVMHMKDIQYIIHIKKDLELTFIMLKKHD